MKIDFQFDTEYGMFSDSLVLSENQKLTEEEIESMKQERLGAWISTMKSSQLEV